MDRNPFQHIDLRVTDHDRAWEFYSKILPPIGFTKANRGKTFSGFDAPGTAPERAWFGFTADPDHRPNANRIAFSALSRQQVDELTEIVRDAGAQNVNGPKACPDYSETYYAVFFEDPFGNRLEICHHEDR
jgi:predicted enzyme related to lactoylglutathione lyase